MRQVVFTGSWEKFFDEFGLTRFDDFFSFAGGERINKNNKRDVQVLTLGQGDKAKVFFLKRFHRPHLKDMLFTI